MRRVFTIACGLLLSVALAGCVDPAPQDGASNRDDGSVTIVESQPDTEPNSDTATTPPDTQQDADTAAESRQVSTPPSDSQAGGAADEPPKSPETTVQDTVPAAGPPTVATVTPVPPEAAPEKPAVDDNPERLMGLGAGELTLMLGSPSFVRRDSSAQLWRYRNKSCILDLFLYRNAGRPEFFVSHVEARRAEGGAALKRKCFGALLLERLDREAG